MSKRPVNCVSPSVYQQLKHIPLECLATKALAKKFETTQEILVDELRKYLHLIANTEGLLAPSKAIDALYHKLLKRSELRAHVEHIVGGTLVHFPGIRGKELDTLYQKTLKQYERSFKKTSPHAKRMWI